MITVSDVAVRHDETGSILSGRVDGYDLWMRFPPGVRVTERGEPFLSVALLIAMSRGEDVELPANAPLSGQLAETLGLIQSVLKLWNPEFRKVAVRARSAPAPVQNEGVISSFSGGVDSFFTLIRHQQEITHIFSLNDFDLGDGTSSYEALVRKNQTIADELGKRYLPIESNFRAFCVDRGMDWSYLHGPYLCLLVAALGFRRFYIPSSYTFRDLGPWGSHPLLDPLWRTETTEIIHDGAETLRTDKTAALTASPLAMRELQVCWRSKSTNCGECSKCARTMIVLNILGRRACFPERASEDLVPLLKLDSRLSESFVWDVMQFARAHGEGRLADLLERRLNRYSAKVGLRRLGRAARIWLGSTVRGAPARGRAEEPRGPAAVRILDPERWS